MEPRGRRRQLVLPPDGPLARICSSYVVRTGARAVFYGEEVRAAAAEGGPTRFRRVQNARPFPLDEVERVSRPVRVGGAAGRRAVIWRRPRRLPRKPTAGGRRRWLFVGLGRGLRRPFLEAPRQFLVAPERLGVVFLL